MRIDPATNAVELVVDIQGAGVGGSALPYNYSDMTGSTLTAPPDTGTWSVIYDSSVVGEAWGTVSWNSSEPGDSSIVVTAASSTDGVAFGAPQTVTDGVDLTVALWPSSGKRA